MPHDDSATQSPSPPAYNTPVTPQPSHPGVENIQPSSREHMNPGIEEPSLQPSPPAQQTIINEPRVLIGSVCGIEFDSSGVGQAIGDIIRRKFDTGARLYKDVNDTIKELWFEEFKKRYRWNDGEEETIKKIFISKCKERYKDIVYSIRSGKSKAPWLNEEGKKYLEEEYKREELVKMCQTNKQNRMKNGGGAVHTCGSKSTVMHLKDQLDKGVTLTAPDIHKMCHTRKIKRKLDDGTEIYEEEWVNEKARLVMDKYNEVRDKEIEQALQIGGSLDTLRIPNETWMDKQVSGGVRKGRVYGLGRLSLLVTKTNQRPSPALWSNTQVDNMIETHVGEAVDNMRDRLKEEMRLALVEERERLRLQSEEERLRTRLEMEEHYRRQIEEERQRTRLEMEENYRRQMEEERLMIQRETAAAFSSQLDKMRAEIRAEVNEQIMKGMSDTFRQ